MNKITFACVLRSGGIYDTTWVKRLRRAVAANFQMPHEFTILTDFASEDSVWQTGNQTIRTVPLITKLPGWWAKMELFRSDIWPIGTRVCFLDLDTAILRRLDPLLFVDAEFVAVEDFYRRNRRLQSCAMLYHAGRHWRMFEDMLDNQQMIMQEYRRGGDQEFIESRVDKYAVFQEYDHSFIGSYKANSLEASPGEHAIVAFHGKPKPHEFTEGWVHEYWLRYA